MQDKIDHNFAIMNEKYKYAEIDVYGYIQDHSLRTIQLPTVVKLSTDNYSVCNDFPIDYDVFGMEPYNDYVIKVQDTYDVSLYIFVHYRHTKTYLLPVVIGFEGSVSCAPVNPTQNWRIRSLKDGKVVEQKYNTPANMTPTRLDDGTITRSLFSSKSSLEEFGVDGIMLELDTTSGVYANTPIVLSNPQSGILHLWKVSEEESMSKHKIIATAPSGAALAIQIWLHTICMWRKRCINRRVQIIHSNGITDYTQIDDTIRNTNHQTIVDINKGIRIYVNNDMTKREFRGYHMQQTDRCGHFRHLKSGRVTYVVPTTVHYKKINPNAITSDMSSAIIYRNTEDFLREKSYLENDVMLMLRSRGILYKREQMFPWMGRKRLDFYLPELNVAIECQGVQHFYKYGTNDKDFENRKKRDEDKYNECKNNGIKLLYFMNPDIPVPKDLLENHKYITDLDELYNLLN